MKIPERHNLFFLTNVILHEHAMLHTLVRCRFQPRKAVRAAKASDDTTAASAAVPRIEAGFARAQSFVSATASSPV